MDSVFALAQSRLPVAIETKFATFPSAIIDTHGKDLTISGNPSRTGTPLPTDTPPSGFPAVSSQPSAPAKSKAKTAKVNATTVVVEADFQASAADLFELLTDEKRIPAWTRAPAQVSPFSSFFLSVEN